MFLCVSLYSLNLNLADHRDVLYPDLFSLGSRGDLLKLPSVFLCRRPLFLIYI